MNRCINWVGPFILVVSMTAVSAFAEEVAPDFARPGLYVAVGGGMAIDTGDLEPLLKNQVHFTSEVGASGVIGVRVGYRSSPLFATEVDMEYATGFSDSVLGIEIAEQTELTMTANLRAYLLTGRFQPYALIGGGFMSLNFSDSLGLGFSGSFTDFAISAGGGVEVYMSENVFLDAGIAYIIPFGDLDGFDHVSIRGAIGYRF